ncbi:hypothetical protein [Polaromonas sp. CG_23.6]|uniref:hypothetical protein n=1 Tax=Polaromonas sp. CG_23.6 TaxID=2760709 RepID=UPI0024746D99|nr:hypothetical protein [Polaromonas sp. CG_23.6]MDH6183380.1 hypothetical protein [Polaromonas sp. CG_23.6]
MYQAVQSACHTIERSTDESLCIQFANQCVDKRLLRQQSITCRCGLVNQDGNWIGIHKTTQKLVQSISSCHTAAVKRRVGIRIGLGQIQNKSRLSNQPAIKELIGWTSITYKPASSQNSRQRQTQSCRNCVDRI